GAGQHRPKSDRCEPPTSVALIHRSDPSCGAPSSPPSLSDRRDRAEGYGVTAFHPPGGCGAPRRLYPSCTHDVGYGRIASRRPYLDESAIPSIRGDGSTGWGGG